LEKSDIFEKFLLGGASVDDSRSYSSWGGFRFILELLCKKMKVTEYKLKNYGHAIRKLIVSVGVKKI